MGNIPETDHARQLKWLKVSDLKVDHAFQRVLNKKRVKRIAANFDPDSFGSLEVSHREDGDYIILDGQHRVAVMYELDWADQKVPCLVHTGLMVADEARIFAVKNGQAARPSRTDLFRAEVVANDPVASGINAVLAARGLIVSNRPGTNHVQAIGSVERVAGDTNLKHLGETLDVLIAAWGRESTTFQQDLVIGVALFTWRYHDADRDRLVRALSTITPHQLLAQARSLKVAHAAGAGFTWNIGVPQIITMLYNKNIRKNKLGTWELRSSKAVWFREETTVVQAKVGKVPAMAKFEVR